MIPPQMILLSQYLRVGSRDQFDRNLWAAHDAERFQMGASVGLEALERPLWILKANASSPGLVQAFSTIMGESYLVT